MTQFSPQMDAALAGAAPTIFGAVELALPSYTVRLLDGAAALKGAPWDAFLGRDPTYGVLAAIENLRDGAGNQAPNVSITLLPASDAAAADLAAPEMQGSPVKIWLGVVEPATGQPVADPELIFLGELDVPHLSSAANSRSLDYDIVSVFERFFVLDEGVRLADSFHQSIWPGETGFAYVTGVDEPIYWGMESPTPSVASPADPASRFPWLAFG